MAHQSRCHQAQYFLFVFQKDIVLSEDRFACSLLKMVPLTKDMCGENSFNEKYYDIFLIKDDKLYWGEATSDENDGAKPENKAIRNRLLFLFGKTES